MRSLPSAVVAALLVVFVAGCGRSQLQRALVPETRPEVRLSYSRLTPPSPESFAVLVNWLGSSPSSKVATYLYAIDPKSVDRTDDAWLSTSDLQKTLTFPVQNASRAKAPHVFAIVAVDEHGVKSSVQTVSFAASNLPPSVTITIPHPSAAFRLNLPSPLQIHWQGTDPDGQTTTAPVRYVYRVFSRNNPDFPAIPDFVQFAVLSPDSLLKLYAPAFNGWKSVSGSITSAWIKTLPSNPDTPEYLFVVTGFDEAGDYDPTLSTNKNMLCYSTAYPGTPVGPALRMYNQFFDYSYPYGGYVDDPSRYFDIEVAAGQPVTVHWVGEPMLGTDITSYRWVLDPLNLADETPRRNEADVRHWSARNLATTSATIGPFRPLDNAPQSHLLYIEADDNLGLRSLGIVRMNVIAPPPTTRDLLIVDDTRLAPDQNPGGGIEQPMGPWPMAAELDTFLYARGGAPWQARPPGTLSTPGVLNGYAFDTLGTRGYSIDGQVPLSVLSGYRHVMWIVDPNGATYTGPPNDPTSPITALRLMSSPGRASSLAAYIVQGGKVWLLGGGGAMASLAPFNNINNGNSVFSRDFNELAPGRLMFDFAHWREEITLLAATRAEKFAPGGANFGQGDNRPGRGWPPNPPLPTPPNPPNYSILPLQLQPKNGADDPAPAGRVDSNGFPDPNYYVSNYAAEFISQPSYVFEDYDDGPGDNLYSTLDTLYLARGASAGRNKPVMTYYHGRDCEPFVFSGFNIWYWTRPNDVALVDFVLGSVWGLQRQSPAIASSRPAAAHRRAR